MMHSVQRRWSAIWLSLSLVGLAPATLMMAGCKTEDKAPHVSPLPVFTGPEVFHGTVGSLAKVRGYEPIVVSGYGLVVNLPGTGSAEVPAYLRQKLLNDMRKNEVGSVRAGTENLRPSELLNSLNTSVVAVRGIIPRGATRGTHFDILVTALPQTQTTSLEGGQLWTAELSLGGLALSQLSSQILGAGGGPIYINPFQPDKDADTAYKLQREGMVVSGGIVTIDKPIELVLNQPSWQRSRIIADRINEAFSKGPGDKYDIAIAKTDSLIAINIPMRHRQNPDQFMDLMSQLYTQRGENFEIEQARVLGELVSREPGYAREVSLAWESMGKTVLPTIHSYYGSPVIPIRLAAIRAGMRLQDSGALPPLVATAAAPDPATRRNAARLLAYMPENFTAMQALKRLLDDEDREVRLEAYTALSDMESPVLSRHVLRDDRGDIKFILDLVPSTKPLLYFRQDQLPYIAFFYPNIGFELPMLARLWDGRLMLRGTQADEPISVYYQPPTTTEGQVYRIAPAAANLAMLLGNRPTLENTDPGLDLTYSQVVNALYNLQKQGHIKAAMELRVSPLAKLIAEAGVDQQMMRPETSPTPPPGTEELPPAMPTRPEVPTRPETTPPTP